MSKDNDIRGRAYWRSLKELSGTPELEQNRGQEFTEGASEMDNSWSRRNFLGLLGASIALAGLSSCRRPVEKIVPYVAQPEEVVPGVAQHYATSMPFGNTACGLLVQSHEGRPTKIEGNPGHPSSRGGTSPFMQAEILNLYDPDRSQRVMHKGVESSYNQFISAWRGLFDRHSQNRGEGLAVLADEFSSPTLARLKNDFADKFPRARWVTWAPVNDENISRGIEMATGKIARPLYNYDKARVILSLDSDFLQMETESVTAARGFVDGRRIETEKDAMNRLYVVEGGFSLTGAAADHRLRLTSSQIAAFTLALAKELGTSGIEVAGIAETEGRDWGEAKWIKAVAADLARNAGKALVVAGRRQPAPVHALVAAINEALDNTGKTVEYREFRDATSSKIQDMVELAADMKSGRITTLVMLGANPAYNAPADLDFSEALKKVIHTLQLSQYDDETAGLCEWHLPQSHFLEEWSDVRALDGTPGIVQPLIEPLHGGKSAVEILSLLATGRDRRGYDIVRKTWQDILGRINFDNKWRHVLHDGFLADAGQPDPLKIKIKSDKVIGALDDDCLKAEAPDNNLLEVVFQADPSLFDGRYANNGWMQELPDPVSKISWDNAALVSPATARALGLENGDVVKLSYEGRELESPIWIIPGQADHGIVLALGYGRKETGRVSGGVGVNAYAMRTSKNPGFGPGISVTKTGRRMELANTQDHSVMEGRPIVREAALEEYRKHPEFAREMVEHPPLKSLWDEHSYAEGYQWGMSIDLPACIGCNACTIACQSENNIPVVGKKQVRNGREMHWIRVDRYYKGDAGDPEMVHQPVACHHCENAPCEQVCPVAATVHDGEGLNTMVYNRCIGTRYCSNNCPYKVRRFNFFNYTNELAETVKMAQNPDVTVRSRGVMEKCTYCVQRINRARISATNAGREVRDGEVTAACEQACPTRAIVFGNINDPDSRITKVKKQNRSYAMLSELNIKPRTTYMAKVRNPNPELT